MNENICGSIYLSSIYLSSIAVSYKVKSEAIRSLRTTPKRLVSPTSKQLNSIKWMFRTLTHRY